MLCLTMNKIAEIIHSLIRAVLLEETDAAGLKGT